ncbi:MAG TPA: phosphate transport system regulatory protein PhoU [Armatimonadetes bacterium]|jgi:phosphate transport system protein|nr:phosphate transport system regulatory protein PhoU [Armatimonadota bacterium]
MRRSRQAFDEQLEQLQQRLLQMGAFVEAMLEKAMRALAEHDVALAREVISADDVADEMDLEIEKQCMRLLALQQPMSKDLRQVGTVMKVIGDAERIGDYSVDIARTAITLAEQEFFKPLVDIPRMAELVRGMLRHAIEALVKRDLDLVRTVIEDDDSVDKMWHFLLDELQGIMQKRPEVVVQATALLLVARYLERIADHTVNIAERVAYMETGQLRTLASSHGTGSEPETG